MKFFLAKTDPETYSVAQLEKDRRTVWDGVTNAQAVAVIKTMRRGDFVFVYHSMGQSAVVGWARVAGEPRPDPGNAKSWVVEFEYGGRIEPAVTLAEIKASGEFNDWSLVRQSRLSTMAAPERFAEWMKARYSSLPL